MKVEPVYSGENNTIEANVIIGYQFECPGCKSEHMFSTNLKFSPISWEFNGDINNPTFSPSLLVWRSEPTLRCHSFVKDGKIQFLGDCYHELKGQTIDLPEIEP